MPRFIVNSRNLGLQLAVFGLQLFNLCGNRRPVVTLVELSPRAAVGFASLEALQFIELFLNVFQLRAQLFQFAA